MSAFQNYDDRFRDRSAQSRVQLLQGQAGMERGRAGQDLCNNWELSGTIRVYD